MYYVCTYVCMRIYMSTLLAYMHKCLLRSRLSDLLKPRSRTRQSWLRFQTLNPWTEIPIQLKKPAYQTTYQTKQKHPTNHQNQQQTSTTSQTIQQPTKTSRSKQDKNQKRSFKKVKGRLPKKPKTSRTTTLNPEP